MSDIASLVAIARRRGDLPSPQERYEIRRKRGVTQLELAAAIGVSGPTISRWETGKRTPSGEQRERYVAALQALRDMS